MPTFPSVKHEETYNAYVMNFSQIPTVEHVSGNGNELIVFRKVDGTEYGLPATEDAILANVYVYDDGFNNDYVMRSDASIIITPERAPLFHKVLDPSFVRSEKATRPVFRKGKKTAKEALVEYSALDTFRNEDSLHASAVGETVVISAYREYDEDDEMFVMTRGYDENYIQSNGTGVISLEAFHAGLERSALIRASLVAYYGTDGVEVV